jgi:hypothetical protein
MSGSDHGQKKPVSRPLTFPSNLARIEPWMMLQAWLPVLRLYPKLPGSSCGLANSSLPIITNLTITNLTITNPTITNLTITNLTITNLTITNLTITNLTITNLTITNSAITHLIAL